MKMARRGGGLQPPISVPAIPGRRVNKRRRVSTPVRVSADPDPESLPPAHQRGTLHNKSRVRDLREAFGLSSDEVSSLPHHQQRVDSDMEWEDIPRRRSLVRLALKLSATICSILYPANPETLVVELGEEIRRAHGGTTADVKSLMKAVECVKECKDLLPRDSTQRAAILAPMCFSLSLKQSKQVCRTFLVYPASH